MELPKFTEIPIRVESYQGSWYWADEVSTCEFNENRWNTTFVDYGNGDTWHRRSALKKRLFSEFLKVIPRPDTKSEVPWRERGFWTITERTVRDHDDYTELFRFGSLRLELKVDTHQGPVHLGTTDAVNILVHVCEGLYRDEFGAHFKYIPIRGEIIFKELFDINNIIPYNSNVPVRRGPPPRPKIWRTRGHARRIEWRISKNSNRRNTLDELELEAQLHRKPTMSRPVSNAQNSMTAENSVEVCQPSIMTEESDLISDQSSNYRVSREKYQTPPPFKRSRKYDLDFICNSDQNSEQEREEEEITTAMYLEAAARTCKGQDTQENHSPDRRNQIEYHDPMNDHTSACSGEDTRVAAGYYDVPSPVENEAPSSQFRERDEFDSSRSDEDYSDGVYDIRGPELERSCYDESQDLLTRRNCIESDTRSQQNTGPDEYCVSDLSQSSEKLYDTDDISALTIDDARDRDRGYFRPSPPSPPSPDYDNLAFDYGQKTWA
ncbi:hypothetical protein VM1G_08530 [Cytospora mali]|uniref:Uncharacterized protein n=1 Tax=Cytospora mali TaxID=578113 RepID=A0A194WA01_CYTMA|nr:hypothetical protein VM1G_08530 [Valsa mali]